MSVQVRPMGDGEELAVLNAGNPLGWVAEWWRGMAPDPDMPVSWWVGLLDGRPAGFAAVVLAPIASGGRGPALVHVLDPARRRGLGTALRRTVEDEARAHLSGLVYMHDDQDPAAAAAVAAWGLSVSATHTESVLDLRTLDRDAFEAVAARPGCDLRPLPALGTLTERDWRALHGFAQERFREAPDTADGGGLLTEDFFRSLVTDPWSVVTAEVAGERVGLAVVMERAGDPSARNTFYTGVAPGWRGRGVALALKARQSLILADAGVERLHTQNMVGNEPILAANRRLGFVRDSGYCDVPVDLA